EHVSVTGQVEQHRETAGIGEIQGHAFLACVHAGEIRALVISPGLDLMRGPALIVALDRPLDLDDAGAEVRQQARAVGAREHAGQIEDGYAKKRQVGVTHRRSIAGRGRRRLARALYASTAGRVGTPPRSGLWLGTDQTNARCSTWTYTPGRRLWVSPSYRTRSTISAIVKSSRSGFSRCRR